MRRPLALLLLVVLLLPILPGSPAIAEVGPEGAVARVVGDPIIMHRQVVARVEERVGTSSDRLATAFDQEARVVELSQHAHPEGADTVYLASNATFADALAAGPLLVRDGAALLLTDPAELAEPIRAELQRLDPSAVVILGGPAAVSDQVAEAAAGAVTAPITRVAGTNRYDTAAAIAREVFPGTTETVVVASGEGFADALAALPAVDVDGAAVLLTDGGRLPPETVAALQRLDPSRLLVMGGEAAIEDVTLEAIDAAVRATPLRLAGPTRYDTAAVIDGYTSRRRGAVPEVSYAVDGNDWRDALAVGPAVAQADARLLVLDTTVRFPPPDLSAAIAVADARAGEVSIQVMGTDGRTIGFAEDRVVAAVSTLKVMFMAAYLRQPDVAGRELTEADRALLEPMITASDNTTASTINRELGTAPLVEIATEVGMQDFQHVPTPWGNTRTSARDQVRLMAELPRLLPDRHRAYALDLLTRIVPEQRWGIGQLELPGWTVRFKGGWGSATGSVNHQSVRLEHRDGAVVALAVTTTNSPSHAYASETLELVFREILATLP
ncbi:cell wall-binding repeat-containing protein [Euzebya tangerina]|uniref:cell wall-binding repeat-containing protein n=1 Tax=Euzebya tangerina TaxID=591198 RepID=UPI0013C2A5BA|nr:cell wall-binding repeat-containing protein [Euzebya tangerina]